MKINIRIFALVLLGLTFAGLSQAATADHLVISQVQITGGAGKTANDFIEIYNPTNADIDLKGMRLVKRTKTAAADTLIKSWTANTIVKSKEYYLWANSGFTDIAATADITTAGTLADDNGVAIRSGANDTGAIIDSVAWGEAANALVEGQVFDTNPSAGEALARKITDQDTNDNSQDFAIQIASPKNSSFINPASPLPNPPHERGTQTPTSTPAQSSSPQSGGGGVGGLTLEISEILPNPKGKDSGFEWIEFYNSGPATLDLAGWYLDDASDSDSPSSDAYAIPGGAKISPFGYLAINIPKGKFTLNNLDSDTLRVFDAGKKIVLGQSYLAPAREGMSFARNHTNTWSWTETPTPGNVNQFPVPVTYSTRLVISEVLANPTGEDSEGEFIEIYNAGSEIVDLADWVIADTGKRYVISEDDMVFTEIPAKGYLAVYREVSGINLNNSGEEQVKLFNPSGELVQALSFDSAKEGMSYVKIENKYVWTNSPTPGASNLDKAEVHTPPPSKQKAESGATKSETIAQVSLANIRSEKLGTKFETRGIISVPPGVFDEKVLYLQGSGIRLALQDATDLKLKIGDEIQLRGELSEYHNELQLKILDSGTIEIISGANAVTPHIAATGDIGEDIEGFLVKISGTITSSAGDTFDLDDGSGEAKVYIKDSTGIDKPQTRKGMQVILTGVVSQYDETYRVMPRFNDDIQIGAVLGANLQGLPRTGTDFWFNFAIVPAFDIGGLLALFIRKLIIKPK